MVEEWKGALGYESTILVSNMGRIKSVRRIISFSDNKPPRIIEGRILKTQTNNRGYQTLRFTHEGRKISKRVHRLVAETFIPNLENKPQVNHKDGVKANNFVGNLEWATNAENQLHAVANGLVTRPLGENAYRFKSLIKVFDKGGNHIDTLTGNKDMQIKGYDFRLVSACLLGKRHSHRNCTFYREIT